MRICSLASHHEVLDDEFEEFLAGGNIIKCMVWYKDIGLRVQAHIYHSIK